MALLPFELTPRGVNPGTAESGSWHMLVRVRVQELVLVAASTLRERGIDHGA